MNNPKHIVRTWWIAIGAGVVILAGLIGAIVYVLSRDSDSPAVVSSDQTSTPSATAAVQPVDGTETTPSPSVSPTSSSSPKATSSASPVVNSVPQSAQAFLAQFYARYKAKERERIAELFTTDDTAELISLRSRLFKGVDPQGNPGGPTLFSTNSAIQSVASYEITNWLQTGATATATVSEQRLGGSDQPVGSKEVTVVLVPGPGGAGTWLIDSYSKSGSTPGKYAAFLVE